MQLLHVNIGSGRAVCGDNYCRHNLFSKMSVAEPSKNVITNQWVRELLHANDRKADEVRDVQDALSTTTLQLFWKSN